MKNCIFKRSIISAVLLILLFSCMVFMLSGCGQVLEYADPMTESVLAGLNSGDYAAFSKDFDDRMKAELTQENFDQLLVVVEEQYGKYTEGSLKFKSFNMSNGVTTVVYVSDFTLKQSTKITAVFQKINDRIKVVGFWIN